MTLCRTARRNALGFEFFVVTEDEHLAHDLDRLFAGLRDDRIHDDVGDLSLDATSAGPGVRARLMTGDGVETWRSSGHDTVLTTLMQAINRRAIGGWRGVALHAGVVAHDGSGLVFPGVMESGKTTLVTGLVRAGLAYLSDEAAAIDPDTMLLAPYRKPLSIDRGAWGLFPELEPHALVYGRANQWQVAPQDVGALGMACPVKVIAFPEYQPNAATELLPMSRAEALVELTKNTFAFKDRARDSLDVLAEVAGSAECYRFPIGELSRAVDLVLRLMGTDSKLASSRT